MGIASMLKEVPHPGKFIRDELEARGWAQRDLAHILGVKEQAINPIMSGKRGIGPEMAKALGRAFDVSPEFFANLQELYEMANAKEPDAMPEQNIDLPDWAGICVAARQTPRVSSVVRSLLTVFRA